MDSSAPTHLSGEETISARSERLARRQSELVCDRRRRAAAALENLSADSVVLPAEADAGGALDDDGDRERGDDARVAQLNGLFVEPRAASVDHRRHGDAACATAAVVHCQTD